MYKRSLETDANDPNVIAALGIAYVNTNRYEPARELLSEVVQTQPENLKAWRYLGFAALQLSNIEQALESYSSALAIDENDWQSLNGLGVAYMMVALEKTDNEFRDKAVLQWKLSLELKPNQQYREKLTEMIRKYSKE
jgi:Flp pilus assembly protein TadD